MKPIFLCILFSICVFNFSQAQNPLVKMWDYRFGGDSIDILTWASQVSDGGITFPDNYRDTLITSIT